MSVPTYKTLEKALALIEDEKNWCQGEVESLSGERCAGGALIAVLDTPVADIRRAGVALGVLAAGRLGCPNEEFEDAIVNFNDFHSHAEVVALFQEAIREEKRKAGIPLDIPAETEEPVRVEVLA